MRSFGILLLLPLLGLLAAIAAYSFGWLAPQGSNNGELLAPVEQWQADAWQQLHGAEPEAEKWRLVLAAGLCSADCVQALEQLRAVHDLVGGASFRVERWLLLPADASLAPGLAEQFPYLRAYRARAATSAPPPLGTKPRAYVIDPLGNVILRYSSEQIGKPMLEDVKRLIKVSRIG